MRARYSLILCTFAVTFVCGLIAADYPAISNGNPGGAVVLRNGNVLVGKVTAVSSGYEVASEGAVLHAPKSDVDYVARSLVEVYERMRSQIDIASAQDHLMLARWCLRYELWPQAARQIVDARGLDPDVTGLEFVEQQLAIRSTARTANDEGGFSEMPESPARAPEAATIETLLKKLPPAAVERFVRRVQPVLVNNCTSVGCHRVDGPSEYQLSRALLYDEANRQSTMRNLMATLEQVDRTNPSQSVLLRKAVSPHGGGSQAPFSGHRRELYQQLAQWVELVTKKEPAIEAARGDAMVLPQAVPSNPRHPHVKRGAFGANHPRAQGRYGSPNVKFGLHLRKVEEPEPPAAEE